MCRSSRQRTTDIYFCSGLLNKRYVGIYLRKGFIYVQIIVSILSISSTFQKSEFLFGCFFKVLKKKSKMLDMMVHALNPSTGEAKCRWNSVSPRQPGLQSFRTARLHRDLVFKKKKKKEGRKEKKTAH